ncbi:hypothetical protein EZV62_012510 [Acer yangbiense]|uniref:Reverse transcriptase Ty1/copia-type domain-containing protein n=1 Tax=Acer yangbiense TaxID=1000413 RepID=A0A5C7HVJ9_9ROSI|nr:hypothetical protein EZV62_012510 [Acer yangbiense]
MTTKESIFTDLDISIKTKVKMGNGDLVESKGQGTMAVQTKKVMVATVNDSTLWHQRFGHYNCNALRLLHQKEERIPEVIEEEELSSPKTTLRRMRPLSEQGFVKIKSELTLYTKTQGEADILIVSLYVDDLIFTGNSSAMIRRFKNDMMSSFEMSDLGLMHYFFRMEVHQEKEGIFISQKKYIEDMMSKFKMLGCKTVATPLVPIEASGEIQLKFCSSKEQLADIFTKALPRDKFQFLRDMLGVTGKHINEEY